MIHSASCRGHAAGATFPPEPLEVTEEVVGMTVMRLVQASLVGFIGIFGVLVAFNNVTDYGSNFAFVQHVLSMDTTFPGNAMMWRAITDPTVHHVFYGIIIAGEAVAGLLCIAGALRLLVALGDPTDLFHEAKGTAFIGLFVGFAVWFLGFMVVGAEWFGMWQSPTWNGQEAAFRFIACIGIVMLFLQRKE
jgi:predicted small integral membrane protein